MKWREIWDGTIKLKPNDKFFTYGTGDISEAIRKIEGLLDMKKKGEKSIANHVGVVSTVSYLKGLDYITREPRTVAYINILEAVFPVFKENPLSKYDDGKTGILIIRDITNSDWQNDQVVSYIRRKFLGKLYNIPAIVCQFVDNIISYLIGKDFDYFSKLNILKLPICSRAVAIADKVVLDKGYGVHANAATPDDMTDYVLSHLGKKYIIVFATDNMLKMIQEQITGTSRLMFYSISFFHVAKLNRHIISNK